MSEYEMMQISRPHVANVAKCCFCVPLLCLFAAVTYGQGTSPILGFQAGQPYASGGIDSVSMNNGNVMVRLPLASLPPGRGGLSAGIALMYQSKTAESVSGVLTSTTQSGDPITYDVKTLGNFLSSAWQYQYKYSFNFISRRNGYSTETEPKCPYPEAAYDLKFQIAFPDGSTHVFRPVGFTDYLNDGFFNVTPDGYGWNCAVPVGHPAQYTLITSQKMVYYSIDGTYMRLEVEHDNDQNFDNNPWTLFFPDGGRVTGGNAPQRIYDRNNNFVEIQDITYNTHPAKRIVDQFNRELILEFDSATNQDFIRQRGFNNEEIVWTVKWKDVSFNKNYLMSDDINFPFPPQPVNISGRMVDQIILPSQAGTLAYTFRYNAASENPPPDANGWGELGTITLPSGAKIDYHYQLDGQDNIFAETVVNNSPTHKDLTYLQEYDGTSTSVTETWQYSFSGVIGGSGSIIAPDGGISTESFDGLSTNLRARDGWNIGISLQSDYPDGSKVERYWRPNTPSGSRDINPFVKTSFTSIKNAAGQYALTAIKDYNYDKNGNVTRVAEYDWVPYSSIARDANGRPTGAIPVTAQLKRITTNTHFNQTLDASNTSFDANAYIATTSPRLRNALASTEVSNASQPLSRTEMTYDNVFTTGNLTEQKNWDSQKGAYSNPLIPSNSISITNEFNPNVSGQLTRTTNARGFATEYTYGLVSGFSDLYPTETRVAAGTAVQRKETRDYDFQTGLVTQVTDVDNNVVTSTAYDVFGRPTLVKAAVDKPEETRTVTEYSDVNRRVIVRADLISAGDGKLVSVQHYDQLGRVRLMRRLEDAAQSATDETLGVKVQTRYRYSGSNSFQLASNPYRASTSGGASGESTMGWTRTKLDNGERNVETQTFAGSGLPAPWGTNTSSMGTVTAVYDANFITTTDQAGRAKKSGRDALDRVTAVYENPGASEVLSSYDYDALGNLVTVVQDAQTRSFAYSSLSRLTSATNPEVCHQQSSVCTPTAVTYDYYEDGSLKNKTDARGIITHFDYDALNRVTSKTYQNDPAGTPSVSYYYDSQDLPTTAGVPTLDRGSSSGRLVAVLYGGAQSITGSYRGYDALGRVKRSIQVTNDGVANQTYNFANYDYDRAGNLKSQTYPSGRVVVTEYDNAGRIAGVKNDATGFYYAGASPTDPNRFQYSAHGEVKDMRLGNTLWEHTNFNSRLQTAEIGLGTTQGGNDRLQLSYDYGTTNNNGNLNSQTITVPTIGQATGFTTTQSYTYDVFNRLETANENGGTSWKQKFTYDRFGNRRIDTNSANTSSDLIGPNPVLSEANNRIVAQAGEQYQYDDTGSLTRGRDGQTYVFDAENKMTSFNGGPSQGGASYTYDGEGKRVKKVFGTTTTVFVYDIAGQLIAEYTNAQAENNGTRYLTADQLDSPRVITDSNGAVKARHDYHPFGEEIGLRGGRTSQNGYVNDKVTQKFTRKERDSETGLDYFGERYYASAQGRFTSVDPLMASARTPDPQSFNRFVFVLNNPLRYVDPDGMDAWDQLTKKEKKIITPKITLAKGQTVRQAFNQMATVRDAKGKIDQQATADKVTTIKNFIDSAGGHTNSAVWQQIKTVNSIDMGRNPTDPSKPEGRVTVTVADKEQFKKVLGDNGYAVNRDYEIFAKHDNDSLRQITQTSFDPGLHFVNDDSSNLNKFFVHWDRRSVAFRQGSSKYWTRLGEQKDAADTHENPYTPSELRQELKKNGTVPRGEP